MKLLEWLGRAKVLNDDITSDALRIASLEAANAALKAQTRAANIKAMVWQVKAEDLQDKLDRMSSDFDGYIDEHWDLMETGRKRKEADARYRAKRRGGK